jgi:two-component system CheB/CheR fusion protein
MVFGQHDLGARAPFPRIDLTLCRNVLIYFTQELQRRALQLFAFSLRENGYLVLGKAESTSVLNESFVPADGRLRVYRRQGPRVLIPPVRARHDGGSTAGPGGREARWAGTTAARRAVPRPAANDGGHQALTQLPVGVVTIDRRYDIRFINVVARRVLGIHGEVVGEDLVHVARRIGADALRELIDRALRDGGASARLALRNDDAQSDGMRWVRAMASPLVSRSDAEPGARPDPRGRHRRRTGALATGGGSRDRTPGSSTGSRNRSGSRPTRTPTS